MLRRAVAIAVACAVYIVKLEEQQGKIVLLDVPDRRLHQVFGAGMILMYAKAVLDDAYVDGVPVTEGSQLRFRHGLPDHPEHRRIDRIRRISSGTHDRIGQAVPAAFHAVEHTAPALGADGGDFRQRPPGYRAAGKDPVHVGGLGLFEECTGTVDAEQHHSFRTFHRYASLV